jgi:hypothetical protein
MTDEEKEIRKAEREVLAEVRKWKRAESKKILSMTAEEMVAYYQKDAEELKAQGFNVIYSP